MLATKFQKYGYNFDIVASNREGPSLAAGLRGAACEIPGLSRDNPGG